MTGARSPAEASAPARVLLARGVALALDRRATCRVERTDGGVFVESREALVRAEAERLDGLCAAAPLRPLVRLLAATGLTSGVRLSGHGRVPASSGLGPDVALVVAAAAALAQLTRGAAAPDEVARLAREALRGEDGAAPDPLDVAACVHGGAVACVAGGAALARTPADPARLEQALLLVDVAVPARADARAGELSDEERRLAEELAAALAARDDAAVPALIAAGWQAACHADPRLVTPEADAVLGEARACGGAGRPCGGGGGGLVALWLPAGERPAFEARLRSAGARVSPSRVDLLGLEVEAS